MKTFGRYLSYRLEKSILRTVVLSLLALMLSFSVVRDGLQATVEYRETSLYILATLLGIICTVIPMLETECFKNRRNLDTLFFLPISRFKMALAHYLSGWIQIVFIYSLSYLWSSVYLMQNSTCFDLSHLLPYYFLSLLIGLVMYSFFMFLFGEANSTLDGIVFCVLGMFAFFVIFLGINAISQFFADKDLLEISWGIVYTPINNLTVLFQKKIHINMDDYYYHYTVPIILEQWYSFLLWGVAGILAAVGYFWSFAHKRAEQIGGISSSWFGYKVMIPLYGYFAFFLFGMESPLITVIIFAMILAGYFIYRRSFRLQKSDIYTIAFGLIPLVAHEVMF